MLESRYNTVLHKGHQEIGGIEKAEMFNVFFCLFQSSQKPLIMMKSLFQLLLRIWE